MRRQLFIFGLLVLLAEAVRYVLGFVEPVRAMVLESRISEGSSSLSRGPVVVVSYEFFYRGEARFSTDVFQPRPPFGDTGWTPEQRAIALRYVDEHPPGTTVRIAVSKCWPYSSQLLGPEEATIPSRFRPSWGGLFSAFVMYVLDWTSAFWVHRVRLAARAVESADVRNVRGSRIRGR